jgi:hypothetical protein
MKRIVALIALLAGAALPATARADVTMTLTMSMSGPVAIEAKEVIYIKGAKMRTDVKMMGQDLSIILDVATKEQLMVNHATKQIERFDPPGALAAMPIEMGEVAFSMKPTGETKAVLGRSCAGFTIQASVPMNVGGETLTMTISGTVWLTKEGAGVDEYMKFNQDAVAAGLALSPLAQGPQGKAMEQMEKAFADRGIPLEQETRFAADAAGEMGETVAAMMNSMVMTTKVDTISTEPVPDAIFVPPADYTRKQQ